MKKIRSLMAICASLTLVFSNMAVVPSSAEGTGSIKVSSSTLEAGDTGTITISIENNPGLMAWRVFLDYDSDAIELIDFSAGVYEGTTSGPMTLDPFRFSWYDGLTTEDYTANGTIATITFTVKEGVEPGDYALTLSGDPDDFYNVADENVDFTFGTGTITVKTPDVAVNGLSISPTSKDFEKSGETVTIVSTVLPANATNKNVTYKSSNTSVATVDSDGKVTAVKEGSADITVTTEDGNFTAVCKVTVAHEHSMAEIPAKASTCKEQGNNKYYKCDECGKYFKDQEGKTETTVEAEKLPLAAHSFTKQDTSEKYLKSAATCTSKAVYYYSCEVCGEKGTETFEYGELDKNNHVGDTEIVGAKAATCDEDGYTGDTVCKSCGKTIEKGKVIPATGHTYSEEWSHDDESHWRDCTVGCGTIIDKATHTGGEATCVKKAVCDVCGTEYGEINPDNHTNTEIRNAKEASCAEEGYTGDTYCTDCGELIETGEVIPKTEHKHTEIRNAKEATCAEEGYTGDTYCTDCGELIETGKVIPMTEHKHTEIRNAKEATCAEEGYTGDTYCTDCGELIETGKVIPKTEHKHTEIRNAKEATCAEEGYTGDTYCTDCGELIETGEVILKTEHKHTEIRNAKEATCAEEGYTGDTYCTDCGELIETGEVIPKTNVHKNTEIRGYIAPTVDSEGYTGDTYCLDCGELIKYGEVIPAHVHQLKKIEAVAATHFAAGNIEYYVCEEDGMKFADAEGTIPLTDEEIEIPVIAHSFGEDWKYDETEHWRECECGEKAYVADHTFGEWTVVRSATEDAEGLEERRCSVCGESETRSISKLTKPDNSESEDPADSSSSESESNSNKPTDSNLPDTSSNTDNAVDSNSSKIQDKPVADTGSNSNPLTGAAAPAAMLGITALGVLITFKKKK